jgi:hypothetical protein
MHRCTGTARSLASEKRHKLTFYQHAIAHHLLYEDVAKLSINAFAQLLMQLQSFYKNKRPLSRQLWSDHIAKRSAFPLEPQQLKSRSICFDLAALLETEIKNRQAFKSYTQLLLCDASSCRETRNS